MLEFLDRDLPFTAVFGGNDNLALGALSALKERGLDVPGQVSIVGFDGIDSALHSSPPLTTMKVSRRRLAEKAVELIVASCAGTNAAEPSGHLSSTWVEGGTLAAPPAGLT
jgi:LacI family transcriptional regulator